MTTEQITKFLQNATFKNFSNNRTNYYTPIIKMNKRHHFYV